MTPLKVALVALLAGVTSIGAAILAQRWFGDEPAGESGGFEFSLARSPGVPEFRLADLEGQPIDSSQWTGQVLVLNFWASWCPPCIQDLPILVAAQQQFADAGVRVVGIAVDRPEDAREFVTRYPVNYPILIADVEAIALSKRLGNRVEGLPFTAVVDRRGRRLWGQVGGLWEREQDLLAALEQATAPSARPLGALLER